MAESKHRKWGDGRITEREKPSNDLQPCSKGKGTVRLLREMKVNATTFSRTIIALPQTFEFTKGLVVRIER